MLPGLLPIIAVILAFAAYRAVGSFKKRRKPRELRGDWWTPFEREFRAYAERAAKSSARDGRRRGRQRPTNPGWPSAG